MITNLIVPEYKSSIQDDAWIIMESDNSGETNFKYLVDIYNYNTDEHLIRSKIFPHPVTGKGYMDVSSVVRNEVTYEWFTPNPDIVGTGSYLVSPEIYKHILFQIGEDYSGVTTTNMVSGESYMFNYIPPIFRRREFSFSDIEDTWITNRPLYAKIGIKEKLLVGFKFNTEEAYHLNMIVNFYDLQNNLLGFYNQVDVFPYGDYTAILGGMGWVQMDLSIQRIQETIDETIINIADCTDSNVSKYVVNMQVLDSGYSPIANQPDPFTIYLDCCPKYDVINLHFMNQYGFFDTARFSLVNKLTANTERKTFQKNDYEFKDTSVEYYNSNNVYKESKVMYGSKTNYKYKLTMDFPTDAEYTWLSELITSPQVYAQIDDFYYPVTITNNNYDFNKHKFNGLKPLQIEIELNQTRFGYRR